MKSFTTRDFDFSRLNSTLVNSGFQKENNPLFQVTKSLIDGAQFLKDGLSQKLGKKDTINTSQLYGIVSVDNGGSLSGMYTPDITLELNVTGITLGSDGLYWTQIGTFVSVFGVLFVTPTAPGAASFGVSLPILSYFKFLSQCAGTGIGKQVPEYISITGDVVNLRAQFAWNTTLAAVQFQLPFSFSYRLVTQ